MAEEGRKRRGRPLEPPIPLEPVDLLAGLAPGVELHADELPPGIDDAGGEDVAVPATMTVAEAGKLVRAGEGTVRRLIRTPILSANDRASASRVDDVDRAGVLPRTPRKPGE